LKFELYSVLKQYADRYPEQLESLTEETFLKGLEQEKEERNHGSFYAGVQYCGNGEPLRI